MVAPLLRPGGGRPHPPVVAVVGGYGTAVTFGIPRMAAEVAVVAAGLSVGTSAVVPSLPYVADLPARLRSLLSPAEAPR